MLALAALFALGAWSGDDFTRAEAGRLLVLAAIVLLLAWLRPHRVAAVGVAAAAVALGVAAAGVERLAYEATPVRALVAAGPRLVRVDGLARGDGFVRDGQLVLEIDIAHVRVDGEERALPGCVRVRVAGTADFPEVAAGDRVAVWAELRRPRGFANPGSPDAAAALRRDGLHAQGYAKSARLLEVAPAPTRSWRSAAARVRAWARGVFRAVLPEGPERAVVQAMTLGDQTAVDRATAESFRIAGTYHVLALSGAQVALLAGLFVLVARRAGLPPVAQAALLTPLLLFYATLVGGQVSIVRATAMGLAALWARAVDLDVELSNVLGASALVMLAHQPSVVGDLGFALSFAATLGLLLLTPALPLQLPLVPRFVSLSLATSVAAQLALTPILAGRVHRLSPAALVLNLVAVPLSSAVLLSGVSVLATALVFRPLAAFVAPVAGGLAHLLLLSGRAVEGLPLLDVRVPGPGLAVLVAYGAGLVALVGARRRAAALLLAGAHALLFVPSGPADGRLHVTALDVGQGDALVVVTPSGRTWLVDAGGSATGFDIGEAVVGPYLWSQGILRIDGLVVSHAHVDHVGGAPFLLRHFRPGRLWEGPAPTHDPTYEAFAAAARASSASRRAVSAGAAIDIDGVRLEVVAPRPLGRGPRRTRNDDSLVVKVTFGAVSFLLTGDVEAAGEAVLTPGGVTVLKVPHHGSRTSSSVELLVSARPRAALLSVGAENRFGHPAPEVVDRYRERGIAVFRTDAHGAVRFSTDGRRLWTHTFH
jgi:competence protein ComEC